MKANATLLEVWGRVVKNLLCSHESVWTYDTNSTRVSDQRKGLTHTSETEWGVNVITNCWTDVWYVAGTLKSNKRDTKTRDQGWVNVWVVSLWFMSIIQMFEDDEDKRCHKYRNQIRVCLNPLCFLASWDPVFNRFSDACICNTVSDCEYIYWMSVFSTIAVKLLGLYFHTKCILSTIDLS